MSEKRIMSKEEECYHIIKDIREAKRIRDMNEEEILWEIEKFKRVAERDE